MHKNGFKSNKIDTFLNKLFKYSSLHVFTLHNNINIVGKFDNVTINYHYIYNMSLQGKLPNIFDAKHLQYFTIFDNESSCEIPNYQIINKNISTTLVIYGNLFTMYSIPNWLQRSSSFKEVHSMYITSFKYAINVINMILSFTCFMFFFAKILFKNCKKKIFYENKLKLISDAFTNNIFLCI